MTRSLRIVDITVLVTISLCALAGASEPVVIVYSVAGEASLDVPGMANRPLRLFDRLLAGTKVKVGPDSRVALAFVNGRRYELGERSGVRLGPKDLASRSGSVRALPRVPPLPRLAPIAPEDRPGGRSGAVRVRAERIGGLYPRLGAAVLPGETFLRFQPVTGAGRYRIEVQDAQGRTVFRTDAESPPVRVPAETLRPGLIYRWTVRTLNRPGAVASGEAEFVTLSEGAARAREKAREILAAERPGSLLLMAEIDRRLGLWLQAREELRTADDTTDDPALQDMLAEIERRLEDEDDSD